MELVKWLDDSVANGTGIMTDADVTNVTIGCSSSTYRVSGSISGLNGTVALQNNDSDEIQISHNGSFIFPTVLRAMLAIA